MVRRRVVGDHHAIGARATHAIAARRAWCRRIRPIRPDVANAERLGAAHLLKKPDTLDEMRAVVSRTGALLPQSCAAWLLNLATMDLNAR
jgi:hypothetical protein